MLTGMAEQQVTVEEENTPTDLETKTVETEVINGVQVPDHDLINPGVNSRTE